MNKSRVCAVAVAAALLSVTAYAGQQSPAQRVPTGLALEIVFLKGQPPSLYPVAASQSKQSGGWSGRFGRVAGWKLADGRLPVRAVQVISRLEGGLVKIWVSVLLGRESIEREEPVISYEIGEEEKVVVSELTRFGVEPIEIKVVKVRSHNTFLPQIVNKTQSVTVTDVTPKPATLPAYQLSLQNLSDKSVAALEVEILVGGKKEIIMMPQGIEGRPLIPAGGHYVLMVSGGYQIRPADSANPPDFSRNHDCVINAAVFSDGSYEGDSEPASRFRASVRGRKIQIHRVVALLQEALNSKDDAIVTLQHLKAELSALKTDVDKSEVEPLLGEFPDLPANVKATLNSVMRSSLTSIKKTVSEELDGVEKALMAAPGTSALRSWLLASKERYEHWFSNL